MFLATGLLNPFTTGNPFLGTKLLGFSIGRGSGALKGLTPSETSLIIRVIRREIDDDHGTTASATTINSWR